MLLGGFSKTFWVTIVLAIVLIGYMNYTFASLSLVLVQLAVLIVGSFLIWRLGGQILDDVTRILQKLDVTRVWDAPQAIRPGRRRTMAPEVYCVHCGEMIPNYVTYCRHCGQPQ